jgi:NADPH:quinone reductase-like Zn-dependent oxidoreductase
MKAIVYHRYGSPDVLQLEEVEAPAPKDGEVLVRVHGASMNAGDWHLLRGSPFLLRLAWGLLKPRHGILGSDLAGRVEAVGGDVRQFRPGDEVFADVSESGRGAFAEYVCVGEGKLVRKPANLSFEEAAAVPVAAVVALQGLRDEGQVKPGQQVLINGASGGVGTFAVQIAKSFGAEVTGVCSTGKLDIVRSIGADQVIDYTQEDFTRSGQRYDLILDTALYRPISDCTPALQPNGIYVVVGGSVARIIQASFSRGKNVRNLSHRPNQEDLAFLRELLEAGRVAPVIDRCYPLPEAAEALRYYGGGHARGKVVITI